MKGPHRFGRLRQIVSTVVEWHDGLKFYRFVLKCGHDVVCDATAAANIRKHKHMRCVLCPAGVVQGQVKDPLAVMFGRRGGLKGGKALNARLTPDERRESASRAAKARWEKS